MNLIKIFYRYDFSDDKTQWEAVEILVPKSNIRQLLHYSDHEKDYGYEIHFTEKIYWIDSYEDAVVVNKETYENVIKQFNNKE